MTPAHRGSALTGTRTTRNVRAWLLGVAAVMAIVRVMVPTSLAGQLAYLVAGIGAAAVAWVCVRRSGDASSRRPHLWIALGLALSATGDLSYQILEWTGTVAPDISAADIPWLGCYAAFGAGLLGVLRLGSADRRLDIDGALDVMITGVVAMLVVWQTTLTEIAQDTSVPGLVRSVWIAYPILDCALLALALRILFSARTRTAAGAWLGGGIVLWLVADFLFMTGATSLTRWLDAAWMFGAVLLACGTLRAPAIDDVPADPDAVRVGTRRVLAGMLPLLAPGLFELWGRLHGRQPNVVVLLAAMAVLVLLACIRGVRLVQAVDRARDRVRAGQRHYRALTVNAADAVLVLDEGMTVREVHNVEHMLGIRVPDDHHTLLAGDLLQLDDPRRLGSLFGMALATPGEVVGGNLRARHTDGSDRTLVARIVNLLADPDVGGLVVNLHDVTAQTVAQEQLAHQAFHDALTGLANRALLRDRIEQALRRSRRTGTPPALLYLDLDGFKTVNDSLGHEAGDELLKEIAHRLEDAVREGDTVSRLGGDEFALLIEPTGGPEEEAEATAARLQRALGVPLEVGEHLLCVNASIGIAVADEDATPTTLLRDADVAMYRAKRAGKARYVRYEAHMGAEALERIQVEADLAGALARGEFEIVYQPVIELSTDTLVGFEALLRWNHPERGTVMPDRFIPIAEETGLIREIGFWVLATATSQVATWQRAGNRDHPLTVAVNLSARQLAHDDIVQQVSTALDVAGFPATSLVLELTETALVQDPARVAVRLQRLRDLGVRVAIDDFGTGASSLTYLRQFPIDILKMDRSFTSTITDAASLPPIIRGLLDLGRTLGIDVVAEGVEETLQRDLLRDERCGFGQGYLFAQPLSAADAERHLLRTTHIGS